MTFNPTVRQAFAGDEDVSDEPFGAWYADFASALQATAGI